MPVTASTTKTMTSASRIASRAWSWTRASIGSSGSSSRPPVSTTTKRRPFHSASPYRRSRVVRARSSTIAVRAPRIRLKSVLLPTFGRPTMATTGEPGRVRGHRQAAPDEIGAVGRRERGGRGRPASRPARAPRGPASCGVAAWCSGVPANGRIRSATSRRSSIGVEVPPVTPTTVAPSKAAASVEVAARFRSGWPASRRSRTAASAPWCSRSAAADDDHQVDLARPARACPPGGGS